MVKKAAKGSRVKKEKRSVPTGIIHIQSTFNNTIVTVTDNDGNVVASSSSGRQGFKGSRKSTPFAAQMAAQDALRQAMDQRPGCGARSGASRPPGGRVQRKRHPGCDPHSPQRLPSTEETKGMNAQRPL
jgi:hypothetical protein